MPPPSVRMGAGSIVGGSGVEFSSVDSPVDTGEAIVAVVEGDVGAAVEVSFGGTALAIVVGGGIGETATVLGGDDVIVALGTGF